MQKGSNNVLFNLKNRKAQKTFPDNSKYEGEMHVDGTRTGKGIMYFKNGDVYFGNWQNDLFNGQGTYIFNNGERYIG